jgi:hypothetical protein
MELKRVQKDGAETCGNESRQREQDDVTCHARVGVSGLVMVKFALQGRVRSRRRW